MNAADIRSAAPQHMEAEMWMDAYVQETLLRQHLTDLDRRAERARILSQRPIPSRAAQSRGLFRGVKPPEEVSGR